MTLLYSIVTGCVTLAQTGSVAYLFVLLAVAAGRNLRRPPAAAAGAADLRLVVLIPAHDEEAVLGATLRSLREQDYPTDRYEVVVVADNCTDRTAEIGRAHGATVLERQNRDERGKGFALNWATRQLLDRPQPADAFILIDADTWVEPAFLSRMAAALKRRTRPDGWCALQGRYGVLNLSDSWRTALMAAALDLYNHVRPLGQDALGCTVGLKGNGMAFTRPVLESVAWAGESLTEDLEFTLRLLREHGVRVGYVPEATVRAQMPVTSAQAASQRERWEGGRFSLLKREVAPLLVEGLRKADPRRLEAAASLLVPPLAELAFLTVASLGLILLGAALHWLPAPGAWLSTWGASALMLAAYVLGGLRVAGASTEAYRALFRAPGYAVWKLALYARVALRIGKGSEWIRTARTPVAAEASETGGAS